MTDDDDRCPPGCECPRCGESNIDHLLIDLDDDDWVWIESPWGRVKAQLKLMEGVNETTVWTWNAVGKRAGAWNLDPTASEATRGFLLNHLITEMLPASEEGAGLNADPITGQAAWYDLRVRVEKALPAEAGHSAPDFATLPPPPSMMPPPAMLRYGAPRVAGNGSREPAP